MSRAAFGSEFYCALTSKGAISAPISGPLACKILSFQAKTLKLLIELRELAGRIDKAMNARPSWMRKSDQYPVSGRPHSPGRPRRVGRSVGQLDRNLMVIGMRIRFHYAPPPFARGCRRPAI